MPNTGTASPTNGTAPCYGQDEPTVTEVLRVIEVTFGYGRGEVLRQLSLSVAEGQFVTLLGPSGCGKTTLLNLIAGTLTPRSGSIHLRGRDVTALPPERRNLGMVYQHYALFPHLSARRNVAFGLEVRRVPRAERDRKVEAMLDLVGLTAAERERKPGELSGGQQQRVALARALVFAPELLLLDEPLANLDRHLRDQLRQELHRLQRETRVAAILVTHDQEEALVISDLLGVMAGGRLLQVGPPAEVYHRPRTPFVARFLGEANLLPGPLLGGEPGQLVLVRPERCLLGSAAESCPWSWEGRIRTLTFLGADVLAEVAGPAELSLRVRARARDALRPGELLRVGIPADAIWYIPDADEANP